MLTGTRLALSREVPEMKRYRQEDCGMLEHPKGEWVKYEEVATLTDSRYLAKLIFFTENYGPTAQETLRALNIGLPPCKRPPRKRPPREPAFNFFRPPDFADEFEEEFADEFEEGF